MKPIGVGNLNAGVEMSETGHADFDAGVKMNFTL